MKKILALLTVFGLICVQTHAATIITRGSIAASAYGFMKNKVVAGGYSGPGDIVSGASFWFGLRAYNAAYAASTGKAVSLRRASDNTTCDFNVATSGGLGVSASGCTPGTGLSLASFATADSTCTSGTAAASTTLTLSGCSSTPHVGSSIAGTGFSQPVRVTAIGSFTSGAGTVTMNSAQTVSAVATTMTYGLFVVTLYDQTGNGVSPTQATSGSQPALAPNCLNSLPCVEATTGSECLGASFSNLSQPVTVSTVAERTGNFTTPINLITGSYGPIYYPGANKVAQYYGGLPSATASDSSPHSIQFIGGTSGYIYVDGTNTSGNTGTGTFPSASMFGVFSQSNVCLSTGTALVAEGGLWASGFTTTQSGNVCHNQRLYWGTGGSC